MPKAKLKANYQEDESEFNALKSFANKPITIPFCSYITAA